MAYDVGATIGIEGEANFKKQLKDIATVTKTLATEMKATSSAFDKGEKSMEAYGAKNAVLEKQIAAQKDKLSLLKQALAESAAKYGEADSRTQKWQQAVNLATAELNDMERELRDNKAAMEALGNEAEELGNDIEDAGKKGKTLGQTLKENLSFTDLINMAKAAAAVIKEVAEAIVNCATATFEWADEIDTLSVQTGIGTERLQELDYMSGLLDVSLDTISGAMSRNTKAMAADNSAYKTLGISVRDTSKLIESSQQAIDDGSTAFARLGVRTREWNGELRDSQAVYDDTVSALSRVKDETLRNSLSMEIFGVSADKANGELRNSETVFFEAIDALGKIENETERDAIAMQLFGKSAKELNPLIEAGSGELKNLAQEAHDVGYVLNNEDIAALSESQDAMDKFTKSTEAARNAVGAQLAPALGSLADTGTSLATTFTKTVNATGSIGAGASAVIEQGKNIALDFIHGIIENAPEMMQAASDLIFELTFALIELAPELVEMGMVLIENLILGLAEHMDELIPAIVDAVILITETLTQHAPDLIAAAAKLVGALTAGLIEAWPHLIFEMPELIGMILKSLAMSYVEFWNVGFEMVKGIISGIKDSSGWVKQQISAWVGDVVAFFKNMLGIASPSKVMADQVGEQMAAGVAVGFEDGLDDVEKDMAAAQAELNKQMAGMAAGLDASTTVNVGSGPIEHRFTGTIRVEGVSSTGEFIASTDILIDQIVDALRREVRFT